MLNLTRSCLRMAVLVTGMLHLPRPRACHLRSQQMRMLRDSAIVDDEVSPPTERDLPAGEKELIIIV